jgi:hypothetical protein
MDAYVDRGSRLAQGAAEESRLLTQGKDLLQEVLGQHWQLTVQREPVEGDRGVDATLQIKSDDGVYVDMMVEVKHRVTPKDVMGTLVPMAQLVRRVNRSTRLLVISAWISPRTQEALRGAGIDYLDLTGNVSLRVPRPAIVVHTQGATRAPASHRAPSGKPALTGTKAGRLVRLLADVAPPYRATDLAKHSRLSLGYVSRLLDTLEDQLLIQREGKVIASVDWQRLLRARAAQTDLLRTTPATGMLAPNGVAQVIEQLKAMPMDCSREVLVTGSHTARALAPLAVGGQLMLYVRDNPEDVELVASELGLLDVGEGADVLLLRAQDLSVWQRPLWHGGLWHVGPSQLVLDCLSGPGRMPAEGEKVLEFLDAHEKSWRKTELSASKEQTLF